MAINYKDLPTAVCAATCIIVPALSKCMPREHSCYLCRDRLLYSKPKALEYSTRSNCLVSLFEGGEILNHPGGYTSSVTVLDLAAGGRMLCQLEDVM